MGVFDKNSVFEKNLKVLDQAACDFFLEGDAHNIVYDIKEIIYEIRKVVVYKPRYTDNEEEVISNRVGCAKNGIEQIKVVIETLEMIYDFIRKYKLDNVHEYVVLGINLGTFSNLLNEMKNPGGSDWRTDNQVMFVINEKELDIWLSNFK